MKKTYFQYLLSLLLFGSNGIVASHILLSSHEIVFFRTLIGSIFLIALFIFQHGKFHILQQKKQFLCLCISGAALGIGWIFLYEAYAQIGVGLATLLYYCGPMIVMALSPLLFHERITPTKAGGFLLVLIGMFCVNGSSLFNGKFSFGLLLGLLSALMYALMIIFTKKASSITGLENSMCQITVSFFTVALYSLFRQDIVVPSISENLVPILILGIINTGIGNYLYFSSLQKLPVQSVSVCGYLEPLSALFFSVILLHEQLSLFQTLGAFLIIGGAALGECLHPAKKHLIFFHKPKQTSPS